MLKCWAAIVDDLQTTSDRSCQRVHAMNPSLLRTLIACALVLSADPGLAQERAVAKPSHGRPKACPANISGKTQHWVIAICEAKAGTDDFENDQVQACVTAILKEDRVNMEAQPDCRLNAAYKKEWCELLVENEFEKAVPACMKSTKNIPDVVSKGGA